MFGMEFFHHAMDKHERAEQIDFCNESRNVGCVDAKVALNFLLTHIPISHVCLQAFIKYTWGHAAVGATRGRGTHRRCATELAIPYLLLGYNLQLFVEGRFCQVRGASAILQTWELTGSVVGWRMYREVRQHQLRCGVVVAVSDSPLF